MRPYVFYAPCTVTADDVAHVDIVKSGRIRLIQYSIETDFDADAESYIVELSMQGNFQGNTNDVIGPIAYWSGRAGAAGTPANLVVSSVNGYLLSDFAVKAQERVYINCSLATISLVRAHIVMMVA